jgi:hypothetical protein
MTDALMLVLGVLAIALIVDILALAAWLLSRGRAAR